MCRHLPVIFLFVRKTLGTSVLLLQCDLKSLTAGRERTTQETEGEKKREGGIVEELNTKKDRF